MTGAAIGGVLLFSISSAMLTAAMATGKMPFSYSALDTDRQRLACRPDCVRS
jgi:hypothetical protein